MTPHKAPDSASRSAAFEARNSAEGTRNLALELAGILDLGRPELAPLKEAIEQERYSTALMLHRDLLLQNLATLQLPFTIWRKSPIDPLMSGYVPLRDGNRAGEFLVHIGDPGEVNWAFALPGHEGHSGDVSMNLLSLHSFASLLDAYSKTGKVEYLNRWTTDRSSSFAIRVFGLSLIA